MYWLLNIKYTEETYIKTIQANINNLKFTFVDLISFIFKILTKYIKNIQRGCFN